MFPNINAQLLNGGNGANGTNPLPVGGGKATIETLFSGAIAANVAAANATVIDMRQHNAGVLEVVINSGNGTWSIAMQGLESSNNGTFITPKVVQPSTGGNNIASVDFPALATSANNSALFYIGGILSDYIKFVPTISGTCNATFKFKKANW